MIRKTIFRLTLSLTAALSFAELALAATPDIGGIYLGMNIDEALKRLNADLQNKIYTQNTQHNLTLTVEGKTGTFSNYGYLARTRTDEKIFAVSASPLTNKVWMITKIERHASSRPSLQSVAEAASKFGKVNPAMLQAGSAFNQHWMYGKNGQEIEWANSYDKPKNGNCFASLETYNLGSYYIGLNYPVAPTSACTTIYSVSAKSNGKDGLADTFISSATDIAAFTEWYQFLTTQKAKAVEEEQKRAAKPSL